MRNESVYELECPCGATIESPTPYTRCKQCGREIEIQGWGSAEAAARAAAER